MEAIKTAKEELQKAFYDIAGRIYQEQGAAAQAADVQGDGTNAAQGAPDDNIVDADFTDAN